MAKLTKRGIEAMDPAEKDYFVWDSELSGFGIRIFPSEAIVVDVEHRNSGHADLIKAPLPGGGIAVNIPCIGLLDLVIVEAGIRQRCDDRGVGHFRIGPVGPWLGEGDHADTGDDYSSQIKFLFGRLFK